MLDRLGDMNTRLGRLSVEGQALLTIVKAGMLGLELPHRLVRIVRVIERFGPAGAIQSIAAIRYRDRPGLADELGVLTFIELDERSNAVANALRARGIGAGDSVGILCRNHRGMFDSSFGVMKAGARALYLNTDFAAPQAVEVCAREGVTALVYDDEFADVVADVDAPKGRFVAWTDQPPGVSTLDSLISSGNAAAPPKPDQPGRAVILTSGTTGTPKGANREQPRSFTAPAAILSAIPFKAREATFVAPPLFHAWGLGMSMLAFGLGSTVVTRRRFDPEEALIASAEHRCSAIVAVPVILNRMLSVGEERIGQLDLSELSIIACSGAQLEAALASRAMDVFGDIVYNLYGSTEVAYATIATPTDMREAPGCVGTPPLGTTVKLYDDAGYEVAPGTTGRIFVGSGQEFGGYTGGGGKEVIDGLMSTGDVGHFDPDGRLFVDGRDDEMIVSGGENVFPREVEELLAGHEAIVEAAALGAPDDTFGQRLRAFVVLRDGHALGVDDVKDFVKANLARYKVPRDVVFVEELPRNPSGKILKRQLAEL